jgi:hypothetical protein
MVMLFCLMLNAENINVRTWYSCVSADDKGEVFIFLTDKDHIIGDDINLTYDKKSKLYTGFNGFGEKVVIGLINKKTEIVFGTSTIKPEIWTCEKLLGKPPSYSKE